MFLATICLAADNPIVGKWICTSNDGHGAEIDWTLTVKQDGGKLAGSLSGGHEAAELPLIEPKLEGNLFTFRVHVNDNCMLATKLKIEGNKFEGTFECPQVTGSMKGTKRP
jgi:hypothetical protein